MKDSDRFILMNVYDRKKLIKNIVQMPVLYKSKGISPYAFMKESGYFDLPDEITENELIIELLENPNYINNWFDWSDDKRTSSGWYFKTNEHKMYCVGYFPDNERKKLLMFQDINIACAAFIKREIESMKSFIPSN